MAKGTTFISDLLKLICNGTAIANLADNAASGPLTNLYLSLHSADPSAGDQTTSEISYTGYARVAIARSSAALLVSGTSVVLVADALFPIPTGLASAPASFAALGTASSGGGKVLWSGPITPSITIELGNAPILEAGSTIGET